MWKGSTQKLWEEAILYATGPDLECWDTHMSSSQNDTCRTERGKQYHDE